jgi:hypothetical protein
VRKGDSILKKGLVLSLLVMYLFIALACIFYLPKYSPLRAVSNYVGVNHHLVLVTPHHRHHSAANIMVLLHRVYQSPFENKRNTFNGPSQTALIIALMMAGSITLFGLLKENGRYLKAPAYSQRYAYLSYRTLRI